MEYKFKVSSLGELSKIADDIVEIIQQYNLNIILFSGGLGAGKTTLIKYICGSMEVTDAVSSPTFALINEYSSPQGNPIYHFDIYRIESLDEVLDLGYEEYIYSGNLCFIEWWEKMSSLLPETSIEGLSIAELEIHITGNNSREITLRIK